MKIIEKIADFLGLPKPIFIILLFLISVFSLFFCVITDNIIFHRQCNEILVKKNIILEEEMKDFFQNLFLKDYINQDKYLKIMTSLNSKISEKREEIISVSKTAVEIKGEKYEILNRVNSNFYSQKLLQDFKNLFLSLLSGYQKIKKTIKSFLENFEDDDDDEEDGFALKRKNFSKELKNFFLNFRGEILETFLSGFIYSIARTIKISFFLGLVEVNGYPEEIRNRI